VDIYTATIAVSIAVYIAIGNYAGRGVKKLDDYYVAGRRAPTLIIVGTLVASVMSSTLFLGEAGFAYNGQAGPFVMWPQAAAAGYVIGAILFGRYLRRSRATTVAEFFGKRFNSTRVQKMAGVTIIFALSLYLLVVTQGGAILLSELTDLTYLQSLVIAWLSYTTFTMYSGSRGVILTDTLMFLLFTIAGVAAAVFVVSDFGGWPAIVTELVTLESKPGLMSWHGVIGKGTIWPTPTDYLIWALIIDLSWLFVYIVGPWQAGRHLMARDEHVVLRSSCITCLIVIVLQVTIYAFGTAINMANPAIEPYERATVWASLNLLPELLGAMLLAGIVAAVLSSASTFLSLVGFSLSNDVGLYEQQDGPKKLRFTRLVMLVIGIVALVVALVVPPSIFLLTMFVATVFASSWGAVGVMSIWSKKITAAAAFWGMLTGLVFNVVPSIFTTLGVIYLPSYLDPALIGMVASLIVVLIVSSQTEVSREEKEYLARLHETPPDEIDAGKTRTSLIAPALLIIMGLITPFLQIKYFVLPYQSATGTLAANGTLNWATGEVMATLGWLVLYVSLGIVAIKVIRKQYMPAS
jgi:sodium/pantothenate symporter